MSGEMKITFRVIELPQGGFVLAEEGASGDYDAMQAVSTPDEACGVLQRRLREWHLDCKTLRQRHIEEDSGGTVIAPRKWWRAVR